MPQRLTKKEEGEYRFNYNSPDSRSCGLIHSYHFLALSERGRRRIQREPSWPVQKEHFSFLNKPSLCPTLGLVFTLQFVCNSLLSSLFSLFASEHNIIFSKRLHVPNLLYALIVTQLLYHITLPFFIEFIFSEFILFMHLFIDIIPASHPLADRKSKGPGPTWVVFSLTFPLMRTLLDTHKQMLNSNE